MVWFILGGLLAIGGVISVVLGLRAKRKHKDDASWDTFNGTAPVVAGLIGLVLGLALTIPAFFYKQDAGEAKVQVAWSGTLVGQTTETGFHAKAPWVNVRTFDVRNNLVAYVGQADESGNLPNYSGNVTTGPQITFQDREGVTGNLDLTVRYSLQGSDVLDIYSEFQTQEAFVGKVISETVRSIAREEASSRTTIQVYNDRAGLAADIEDALIEALAEEGVTVEAVNLQEVRYSAEVVNRFDEAQAARIAVDKAEAEQEAATVTARTKVIEAQGVADAAVVSAKGQSDANDLLTKSLTPEVLQQRYIDALKDGTIYVVPAGSTPLITTK